MITTYKKTFLSALFVGILLTAMALYSLVAHANPLYFLPTAQTATATTTVSYMQAGKATTTLVFDSYSAGQPQATNKAVLLLSFTGSSTASILNTNLEYSIDGIDWYQEGGSGLNAFATTSKPFDIGQVNQITFGFSSTTAGLPAVASTNATTTRALTVQTPTRYVRAVFTVPVGSTAGAIWAQFVGVREKLN